MRQTLWIAAPAMAFALAASACSERELVTDGPAVTAEPAPASAASPPDVAGLPAGVYRLDASHGSLVFNVSHLGFSNYTAGFDRFDATLEIDPAKPAEAKLSATVDVTSLDLPSPPDGFLDELLNADWLGAAAHPQMRFESRKVTMTGPATADVEGDLTLKGATQPVVLHATFNGGWAGIPPDPNARIGFSAHGVLKRSAFGVSQGIPEPGSTMGVSDDVTFAIEAELTGPPWTPPEGSPAAPAQ